MIDDDQEREVPQERPPPTVDRTTERRARWKVALSILCASIFTIPFRIAARDGRGAGAALGLLLAVVILFAVPAAFRVRKIDSGMRRRSLDLALRIALAAAFGNMAQGFAFEALHPGVAATLIQMNVLFVAVLGALWLKEVPTGAMWIGVALAALGVVLTQPGGFSEGLSLNWGVLAALVAAFGFSLIDLFSRRDAHAVDSLLTNFSRALLASLLLALVPACRTQLLAMPVEQLAACGVAAIFGPGFARQLLISAAKDLSAVEAALMQQARPLLVLPMASLFFDQWPSGLQWLGCLLVVLGVTVPYLFRARRQAAR